MSRCPFCSGASAKNGPWWRYPYCSGDMERSDIELLSLCVDDRKVSDQAARAGSVIVARAESSGFGRRSLDATGRQS